MEWKLAWKRRYRREQRMTSLTRNASLHRTNTSEHKNSEKLNTSIPHMHNTPTSGKPYIYITISITVQLLLNLQKSSGCYFNSDMSKERECIIPLTIIDTFSVSYTFNSMLAIKYPSSGGEYRSLAQIYYQLGIESIPLLALHNKGDY